MAKVRSGSAGSVCGLVRKLNRFVFASLECEPVQMVWSEIQTGSNGSKPVRTQFELVHRRFLPPAERNIRFGKALRSFIIHSRAPGYNCLAVDSLLLSWHASPNIGIYYSPNGIA